MRNMAFLILLFLWFTWMGNKKVGEGLGELKVREALKYTKIIILLLMSYLRRSAIPFHEKCRKVSILSTAQLKATVKP